MIKRNGITIKKELKIIIIEMFGIDTNRFKIIVNDKNKMWLKRKGSQIHNDKKKLKIIMQRCNDNTKYDRNNDSKFETCKVN